MNTLQVQLKSIDDKVKFSSVSRQNDEVITDYFPPFGTGEGYTPLELILISLSSCLGTVLLTLIRGKMQKEIISYKTNATGIIKEEHPKAFSQIDLELIIESKDVEESDIERALYAAEEKLCPVWAMIRGNVKVNVTYKIIR
ncbi:MAG: hypothetical protein BWY15_00914 [Firmicutes bacterium ADurb.Bin193]|nr:MAG: hypothetical protein BWY15_00914 [Firmicutes bacterium ADurb.Bin193]